VPEPTTEDEVPGFSFALPGEGEDWPVPPHPHEDPTSHGPASSFDEAPPLDLEPPTGVDDAEEEASGTPPVEEEEPLPEFDPKYRKEFEGLMFLGALQETFFWMGHSFTIRTLKADEIVEIGLMVQPYGTTLGSVKAYQAASIAAALIDVDGRGLPLAIDKTEPDLRAKFRYILDNWYPPVIDAIYDRMLRLEHKVGLIIQASLGEAQG
jgi:hypothetical protein